MTPSTLRPAWQVHVGGTLVLCLIVGLLHFLIRGGEFGLSMLYAFAIGVQISLYISLLYRGLERLRARWRPVPPEACSIWIGWGWMMPCILLGSVAGYASGQWLGDQVSGRVTVPPWQLGDQRVALSLGFTLLVSLLASLFFFSVFKFNAARLDQANAQRQAAEARLTLLQSQLEPHMLFNTLAHLRVLIKLRPEEAQHMLDRLIDYLRATLQASRAVEHPLAQEFERLADYLALMQLRMGERLRVHLDLPEGLRERAIPPLLLQPLVENAIKHGLEPHVNGGELRVTASLDGHRLVLEVADNGTGLALPGASGLPGTGFGLSQVRERLAQRYGSGARFTLTSQPGGGSLAHIEIPT